MKKGTRVELSRRGFDYHVSFESISSAARATGRSISTVRKRASDGLYLHADNGVALKVRYAE